MAGVPPPSAQAPFVLDVLEASSAHLDGAARARMLRALDRARAEIRSDGTADPGLAYFSHHTDVNAVQALLEAEEDGGGLDLRHAALTVARSIERLFVHVERVPFPAPLDARHPLAPDARVALFSDWGTGTRGSGRVAAQIAALHPHHAVHLGDIYPLGEQGDVSRKFIEVWRPFILAGPGGARVWKDGLGPCAFWALNGNHEMKRGGASYFGDLLPWCRNQQGRSCFALENAHWRLIAMDTAYEDFDLHDGGQHAWLERQLAEGPQRKILLSHHQPFSAVDPRPSQHRLLQRMYPFLDRHEVFAWFWGHEHGWLVYEPSATYWNVRARCLGHGGQDIRHPYFTPAQVRFAAPPLLDLHAPPDPDRPRRAQNGFCMLDFDGPDVHVRYLGEDGAEWWSERWTA